MDAIMEVDMKAKAAKEAAFKLVNVSTKVKDDALLAMASALEEKADEIIEANKKDLEAGKAKGTSAPLLDRLMLNSKRISSMSEGLRQVAALPDPIGEIIHGWKRPNGLIINKVRVPLGVIGIIYESRPNVTVDAAGLCLKSGNAVILRGGSDAINSNIAVTKIISEAATSAGLPEGAISLIESTDRAAAQHLMKLNKYVDVLIPRGGAGLIQTVVQTATVPIIETGVGNCHTFIDESADLKMAEDIAFNAKCQRPGVCNAMETLLIHKNIALKFIPPMFKRLKESGVEIRGDAQIRAIDPSIKEATEEDWYTEFLALILAVKIIDNVDDAINHINKYSSRHSEAIVTQNYENGMKFTQEIDSAAVYINASTRFTDGFEFGLGAEIGISTQKLHARGPMGLEELTSVKFVIYGEGQIRG